MNIANKIMIGSGMPMSQRSNPFPNPIVSSDDGKFETQRKKKPKVPGKRTISESLEPAGFIDVINSQQAQRATITDGHSRR
jgi:hypothetical protein